jgi:hypothetical protein
MKSGLRRIGNETVVAANVTVAYFCTRGRANSLKQGQRARQGTEQTPRPASLHGQQVKLGNHDGTAHGTDGRLRARGVHSMEQAKDLKEECSGIRDKQQVDEITQQTCSDGVPSNA